MAGDTQRKRHTALTQGLEKQDEEIVGFHRCGPVHSARFLSTEDAAQYSERPAYGKAPRMPELLGKWVEYAFFTGPAGYNGLLNNYSVGCGGVETGWEGVFFI